MKNFKQMFTLLFFGITAAVTVATSKLDHKAQPLPDQLTNYSVESSCAGSISDAKIRVNRNTIIDASYPLDGTGTDGAIRSFRKFGFSYYSVNIGRDARGIKEDSGNDCIVKGRESAVNDSYDSSLQNYWFYKTGFYTTTTYDCYEQNKYLCTIVFEELPALEFSEINR